MRRTIAQDRAVDELVLMSRRSRDALRIDLPPRRSDTGVMTVGVWFTPELAGGAGSGVALQDVEHVLVHVPPDFPISPPSAEVEHERFAGQPHVQWRRHLCLYASSGDWEPARGMVGFVERLALFYRRLHEGTLDGAHVPWHPPVAYVNPYAGCFVVRADLPPQPGTFSWALLRLPSPVRADIVGWHPTTRSSDGADHPLALERILSSAREAITAIPDSHPGAPFLGLGIRLRAPLSFEYPTRSGELLTALGAVGVDTVVLLRTCMFLARLREGWAADLGVERSALPLLVVLRAPMPAHARPEGQDDASGAGAAHFAAWRLIAHVDRQLLSRRGEPSLHESREAEAVWVRGFDARPEATHRRDADRPATWLYGRHVLLLGCGALGGPIAEHCARAGVRRLDLVDKGVVSPGILVRQPYGDPEIGAAKAHALALRLQLDHPGIVITFRVADVARFTSDDLAPEPGRAPDVVIDATADTAARENLEHLRWSSGIDGVPLVTLGIGHAGDRGMAAVSLAGAIGGGMHVLRLFAAQPDPWDRLSDVHDDLFPVQPRTDVFTPEPGCSSPTFRASTTDVSILAAQLLDRALHVLQQAHRAAAGGGVPPMPYSVHLARIRGPLPDPLDGSVGWEDDLVVPTGGGTAAHLQIRLAPEAQETIRTAVADAVGRGVDAGGPVPETGGALVGDLDRACRTLWISAATGPPAGVELSPLRMRLPMDALRPDIDRLCRGARGTRRFLGFWHSHPGGSPVPSSLDRQAMQDQISAPGASPEALLLIIGGQAGGRGADAGPWQLVDLHAELFELPGLAP